MLRKVIFLEYTRAMDNPYNMVAACEAKGKQYRIPHRALLKAQEQGRKKQEAVASNEQLDLQASVSVSCSDFLKLVNEKLEETERLKRYRVGGFVLNAPRRRQAVTF